MPIEPLLQPNRDRFVLFPIKHQKIWDMYKAHEAAFWTTEDIDMGLDMPDWQRLTDGERHFIKYVLAFFAASDGIVNENLATRFMREVQSPEARLFYGIQIAMENVHAQTYSMLLQYFIKDEKELDHLFHAIDTIDCIKKKADWALKWIDGEASFGKRLVAFASVEGIHFSGPFCSIYYMKKRRLLPGLCHSNRLISADEALHRDFACLLFSMLEEKPSEEEVLQIITEAVELEKQFVTEALPVSLLGINAEMMSQYIEYVADHLLVELGFQKHYHAQQPFDWMEMISLQGKTNMFEGRVPEYKRPTTLKEFALDAPF